MAEDAPNRPSSQRSPGYPCIDLATAVDRAKSLKEYGGFGRNMPVSVALKQWGYGAKSGAGHQQLAALIKYDLLEDEGKKDQRVVRLTGLAKRILLGIPGSGDQKAAVRQAALAPSLIGEIQSRWQHGLPDDAAIASWLGIERNFNENAIAPFLKVLRSNYQYAELDSAPGEGQDTTVGAGESAETKEVETAVEPHQTHTPQGGQGQKAPAGVEATKPPPSGLEENRWKLPSGSAVVWLPSTMTARDFRVLRGQIDLLELSLDDDEPGDD